MTIDDLLRGLLVGLFFVAGLPIGAVLWLCIHALVRGRWGAVLHPALGAFANVPAWLALAFVPLLIGLDRVYPGASPWFVVRTALVLAAVGFFAQRLTHVSAADLVPTSRRLASLGLVVVTVAAVVGACDWGMSLDPDHVSGVYPLRTIVGWLGTAFAAAVALTLGGPNGGRLTEQVRADLGSILVTVAVLWTYLLYADLVVVWTGDLPKETSWWSARGFSPAAGSWAAVGWTLVGLQLGVPLATLLFRAVKRSRWALFSVACVVVIARALDALWTIAPTWESGFGWGEELGALAPMGILGTAIGVRFRKFPEVPPLSLHVLEEIHDPAWVTP
jgi:hypothetical protein